MHACEKKLLSISEIISISTAGKGWRRGERGEGDMV